MPKTRTGTTKPAKAQELSLHVFAKRLAEKNAELLSGFVLGLENGELSLELEDAEAWIDAEIDEWCETEEPNRELHLRLISAVFVWMLLDELYAEEIDSADEKSKEDTAARVERMTKLSIEVIRTVQSIWGLLHGAKV